MTQPDPKRVLPAPTRALFTEGRGGYGHRLFLPSQIEYWDEEASLLDQSREAHDLLTKACCWGGCDKRWAVDGVLHLGYEFPIRTWEATKLMLLERGITIEDFSPSMDIQSVW